jgi:5-methylthioadenosine/S-adenosylhomocysteine deaminase
MDKLILQSARLRGELRDVLVVDGKFAKTSGDLTPQDRENAEVADCRGMALVPAFYNGHCHAAMTLLRGYADGMPLDKWLREYIWPFEARLTPEDIEIGTRLAVLEMIKSGTVFFSDMYWQREHTMRIVGEMGIRATIGVTIAENIDPPERIDEHFRFLAGHRCETDRVHLAVMPHAIYTVGEKVFRRCADIARAEGYVLHTHLSETRFEVDECLRTHGCTPAELLDRWGILGDNLVAAHCVHLTGAEMERMAAAGATAILNPCSNLKLGSGIPPIAAMLSAGMKLGLGTDGASSNNNLDMHEEMKIAALLAKVTPGGTAETLPAARALELATSGTAAAYGLHAGEIADGYLADALLVDLSDERLAPDHDFASNWVYSADSSSIHSVLCAGKFVMRDRRVPGEAEIVSAAERAAARLAGRPPRGGCFPMIGKLFRGAPTEP